MTDEQATETEAEPKREAEAESSVEAEDEKPKKKKKAKDVVSDPRAVAIAAAFDAGNFQRVRELAAELSKSESPALQDVAADYATRIAVDPVQIAFLGLCAIALLTIAWIYVPH